MGLAIVRGGTVASSTLVLGLGCSGTPAEALDGGTPTEGATTALGPSSGQASDTEAADTAASTTHGEGTSDGESSGSGGAAPGPWDAGWPVPAEPQSDGDPEAGRFHLTHSGYISCGIPYSMWGLARPFIEDFVGEESLPGREGDNADMPYDWTVHTAASGVRLASQNCLQCHAEYFDGELVVGLGNAHGDFTRSMGAALALVPTPDFPVGGLGELLRFIDRLKALDERTAMLTVGTNPAEMVAVTLVAHRDPQTLAWSDALLQPVPDIVVPSDVPPWWRAHKKNGLFYNAMARGDHLGTMMLATSLCTDTVQEAQTIAAYFDDVHAYVRSIRPPPYPFAIDAALAAEGKATFHTDCAPCHGTYGATEADDTFPNLLFPLDVIGTDPVVAEGGTKYAAHMVDWYNGSFYGSITRMEPDNPFPGYMAPPLDGVWATGPFLHNGSVPTIEAVLDTSQRPTYWMRIGHPDYDTSVFDEDRLGWPYIALNHGQDEAASPDEAKRIYDTTRFAHENGGHIFGDHLSDGQRRAVLEYLKTL